MPHKADPIYRSPSVVHITQILQERIDTGLYRGGHWLPAERVLAEEFKVSRVTIRQALDELERLGLLVRSNACRPLVRMPVREEVAGVPTERRNISIWMASDPSDIGVYTILQGVQQALNEDRFRLVIASPNGRTLAQQVCSEARFLERIVSDREIAGVLIWYLGGQINRPVLEKLRAAEVPIVFLDRCPPTDFVADYVGINNKSAAKQVVRHLLDLGHRRIAHITNPEAACTVEDRLHGYTEALQEAGIAFDPGLVFSGAFLEDAESRYATIVQHLLTLADPPTAVFAVNDYSALCLIATLREQGIRIPEEMAVAGFDDLERWRPGPSFVTTISQPFDSIGREAVRLLMERIAEGVQAPSQTITLSAPLVVRNSTIKSVESGVVPRER